MRRRHGWVVLAIALTCAILGTPAQAQVSPPPGWSSERRSGGLVFEYPGVPDEARVVYQLYALQRPEGVEGEWFASKAQEIAGSLGDEIEPLTVASSATGSMSVLGFTVTSPGERLVVLVSAWPVGPDLQLAAVVGPQSGEQPQSGSDQLAATLAGAAMRLAERSAYRRFGLTQQMTDTGTAPPPRRGVPQRGIGSSRVEDVLIWYWGGGDDGPAGGMKMTTYLLLKDGRLFVEEPASPVDFDPATRPPDSWGVGTWRRLRGGYEFRWPTEVAPAPSDEYFRAVRAPENLRFSGLFRLVGAGVAIGAGDDEWRPPEGLELWADGRLRAVEGALYEPDDLGPGWKKKAYGPELRYRFSGRTGVVVHPDGREERMLLSILGPPAEPLGFVLGDAVYQRVEP